MIGGTSMSLVCGRNWSGRRTTEYQEASLSPALLRVYGNSRGDSTGVGLGIPTGFPCVWDGILELKADPHGSPTYFTHL